MLINCRLGKVASHPLKDVPFIAILPIGDGGVIRHLFQEFVWHIITFVW